MTLAASGRTASAAHRFIVSWICEASGWKHQAVPKDILKASEEWAKEQLEEEEEDDEDEDEGMEE